MTGDKDDLSCKWRHCREELEAAEARRQELERGAEKAARTSQSLETETARLEAKVEELNRELVDRGLLISQLERLGSSLREEAMELRYRYTKREYLYVCTMFIVYSILPAPSLSSRSLACRYLWREKLRNFVPRARAQL